MGINSYILFSYSFEISRNIILENLAYIAPEIPSWISPEILKLLRQKFFNRFLQKCIKRLIKNTIHGYFHKFQKFCINLKNTIVPFRHTPKVSREYPNMDSFQNSSMDFFRNHFWNPVSKSAIFFQKLFHRLL